MFSSTETKGIREKNFVLSSLKAEFLLRKRRNSCPAVPACFAALAPVRTGGVVKFLFILYFRALSFIIN